jgi:transposase-like protein
MRSHFPTPDRSPTLQVNIKHLIDEVQCYQTVRDLRWPDGIACPFCQSKYVIKRGFDDTEPARQRYECHDCDKRFDDLTDTIFAGHHQPLKVWVLCLYFMGLNLSNEQIAQELALHGQTWPRHPCHQWGLKTTGCARVPDRVLTSRTRLGMLCYSTYCSDILSPERRHCGHCQPP